MSEVQLEGSEGQLEGYEAQLEGTEGHLEGSKVQPRGDGRMDGRKISPFYRTSSPYQGRCPKIVRVRSHAVNFCMRVHFCVHVYFRIRVCVHELAQGDRVFSFSKAINRSKFPHRGSICMGRGSPLPGLVKFCEKFEGR